MFNKVKIEGTTETPNPIDSCVCNAYIGAVFVGTTNRIFIKVDDSNPCVEEDWLEITNVDASGFIFAFVGDVGVKTVTNESVITLNGTNGITVGINNSLFTIDGHLYSSSAAPVTPPTETHHLSFHINTTNNNVYAWNPTSNQWVLIKTAETITTLVNNGNGTYTYTNENGTQTTFGFAQTNTTLTNNNDGTITYTNEQNNAVTISILDIINQYAVNLGTGLAISGNTLQLKNALNQVISTVTLPASQSGAETVTTLVDNEDGTYTYTSEDDTETVINTNETLTTLTYNGGTGVLTYTGENGTPVNINLPLEYHLVSAAFNSSNNILTLTLSDTSTINVDLSALSDSFTETVTSITYNPTTRIITYTDENSFDTELDLSALLDDTNNYLTGASFNTGTNILTLTRQGLSDVTVDLSDLQDSFTDNYVDGISFDTNTSILTLNRTGILADLTVDLSTLDDETTFTFNDTNSLDVTMTGTGTVGDPFTLTGDVNIDSDIDNLISITTEGLLAKETVTTISYNSGTTTITYTDESGGTTNIDLSALLDDTDNYVTGIGFNEETNFLTIFRNNGLPNLTADLSELALYINNYVTGVSFNSSNNILTFARNGGLSDLTVDLTPLEETVTTLVKNADGTITYTSENATQTTFSLEDLINMQESTPYIGTVSSLGDNTIVSAPGAGFRLKVVAWSFWNETTTATKGTLKTATVNIDSYYMLTEGCGKTGELQLDEDLVLGENEALVLNLSVATTVGYSVRVQTIAV
ncbi:MAG: hypothetical protein KDH96_00785 [Candidatus Riesia sp.]|nr:hypothetical protein [Candidatus Riesia sp.]